jgi:hypothetical protein
MIRVPARTRTRTAADGNGQYTFGDHQCLQQSSLPSLEALKSATLTNFWMMALIKLTDACVLGYSFMLHCMDPLSPCDLCASQLWSQRRVRQKRLMMGSTGANSALDKCT